MRFAIPHMLWLLILLPVVGAFLVWAVGHRRALLGRFGSDKALAKHGIAAINAISWVRIGLFLLGLAAVILGLARPQWGYHERQVVTRGVDMVIAVDTSASMMAKDFPPNRLSRAKDLLKNLIWEARGDRVGIVAFSGSALVMCPLTLDYNMAATALKAVDVNTVSTRGTNIGAAINAAKGAFDISGSNDRILVLLTDGEQMELTEELDAAISEAKEVNIKIFSIGLGTADGAVIPTMAGPKKDATGNVVRTSLDFETLKKISSATGGQAIRAEKIGAGEIADITSALSQFRGRKQQDKTYKVFHDRYPWFLGAALLFFVAEALLAGVHHWSWLRRRRRIASGTGLLFVAIVTGHGAAFAYPGEDFVRSRDALQKYRAGDYNQSTSLYDQAAKLDPQDPQIHYNLGAAASKAGKVDAAREAFGKVYDPTQPALNAEARFGMAILNHRDVRKVIAENKEQWAPKLASGDEAATKEVKDAISKLKEIIGEYKETILAKPDDIDMKANYELAKKDLEELEKLLQDNQSEQQQQQQQDQQQKNEEEKKDEQKQGEDQKDKQDSQGKEGEKGKDDPKPGEDSKPGENPPEDKPKDNPGDQPDEEKTPEGKEDEKKPGEDKPDDATGDKPGDQKKQDGKPDPKGTPAPTPTPSPTPTGTSGPGETPGQGSEPSQQGQPVPVGQMSPTDVDRLLNTLPPEDQRALQLMMGAPTDQQDMKNDW